MQQTPGSQSDLGRTYRYQVITYIAGKLSSTPGITDFVIFIRASNVPYLILKLWLEEEINPHVYVIKTKYRTGRPIFITSREKDNYEAILIELMGCSSNILQDVPNDNIHFWLFSNNNVEIARDMLHEFNQINPTSRAAVPFELSFGSCFQIYSSHDETFRKLYFILDQPDYIEMEKQIEKTCNLVYFTNIINYVDNYFKVPHFSRCGLTKTNFDIELLKIHAENYIVNPTNIVDVNEDMARIWNDVTIEHQATIIDNISMPDTRLLFGCFVHKINRLFDHTLKWDDCLFNEGKLDPITIAKFKDLYQNSPSRQWIFPPENIITLIKHLWLVDELPLILKVDELPPFLGKYKHLGKRFILTNNEPIRAEGRASCFQHTFTNVANIKTDTLRNNLLQNLTISLQGRTPTTLYDIIGSNRDCMEELSALKILQLIRKREMYLDKRCLDEAESTIFIIEDENSKSGGNGNKMDADDNDTIVINCKSGEMARHVTQIEADSVYRQHSICCLRSVMIDKHNKLEFLAGDKQALRRYFIDDNGDGIYCVRTNRPIPIIGQRLDNKTQVYIPRYLRKAIIPSSVFKTQDRRICLLSGDVDSLDGEIKEQLIKEDIDYNAKIKIDNNENVFIDDKIQSIEEYWQKFSCLNCPLFHVKVENGRMELQNYKNCSNMSSYITYSKEAFPEVSFCQEIDSKLTVISGEPGIGKSSLLRSLSEASDQKNYVLSCNLADYREDLNHDNRKLFANPLDYIFNKFEKGAWIKFLHCLYKYHKSSCRLTLFIDSFDEVLPMLQTHVLRFMKAVATNNIRIIVASRLYFDTILINNFEVQPIEVDNLQEIDYVSYFKTKGMQINNLNKIPSEFLVSPLFITFLWFLHREGAIDLTRISKYAIYKSIITKKIERYYRKSKLGYNSEAVSLTNDVLRLHRLVALVVVFGKELVMQLKIVPDYPKLIENFKTLKMRLGIVKHFSSDYPIFLHQSFAEFMVAEWLYQMLSDDDFDSSAQTIYEKMMLEHDMSVRHLFDNMVCGGLKLHKAILDQNLDLVRKLADEDKRNLTLTDKCGRNALLLASSYYFDKGNVILEEVLLKSYSCKVDFLARDLLMKWNWFQCLDILSKDCFFDQACSYNLPVTITKYLTCRERSITVKNILSAYQNCNLDVMISLFTASPSLLTEHFLPAIKTAIKHGRMDVAYDLVELKCKCNMVDTFRSIPHPAYLVKFVETQTKGDFTALHLACMLGNQELVKELLEDDIDAYVKDVLGNIPLHYAIIQGKAEMVMLLLDEMPDVNMKNEAGDTFLHLACRFMKDELIELLLLDDEVDINDKNLKGETPLHAVAAKDWQQIIDSEVRAASAIPLERAIKSVDEKERNFSKILMRSLILNQSRRRLIQGDIHKKVIGIIDTLLNFASNVTEQDEKGNTPLHLAYKHNNTTILKYLIDKSDEAAFIRNANGLSVFEIAQQDRKVDIVKYIQETASEINQFETIGNIMLLSESEESSIKRELRYTGQHGRSLLHTAVINGRSDFVRFLLEKGFPIDGRDDEGYTPLHFVRSASEAQLLINKYANFKDAFKRSHVGETPLSTACRNGYIGVVTFLLMHNSDVNTRNKYDQTPLHLAAMANRIDVASLLLKKGADVNASDINKATALHLIIPKGSISFVELLLKNDANSSSQDNSGNTPIHLACQYGHIKLVEALIKKSSEDASICNGEGYRAYDMACVEGRCDLVDFLVKKFPVKDELTISGDILYKIVKMGHLKVLKILLKADILSKRDFQYKDNEGNTLLHVASSKNHIAIVHLLLENDLEPNSRNKIGETPLHLVQSAECAEILLSKYSNGSNPHTKTKFGETPLHVVSRINSDVVKILLNAKADVASKDSSGWTPLHIATWANRLDVVQVLLKNGANVNETNNYSGTALHIAATKNLPLFRTLLNSGADVNAPNKFSELALQQNPHVKFKFDKYELIEQYMNEKVLDIACTYGKHDVIEYLLKNHDTAKWFGISEDTMQAVVIRGDIWCLQTLFDEDVVPKDFLRCTDSDGNTLLHVAVIHGYQDIVSCLIEQGADVNVQNKNDMTPLTLAALKGHTDIINHVLTSRSAELSLEDGSFTLAVAVLKNNAELASVLLKSNVDTEKKIGALHLALVSGSTLLLQMLMDNGIDLNAKNDSGCTALEHIFIKANASRIKFLLGAYPCLKECSISNDTLFEVVKAGKCKCLQILFEERILTGDVLECSDEAGRTPLHVATIHGHTDLIQLLLETGAAADCFDKEGYTPLHFVKLATDAQLLINAQTTASINAKTHTGLTPLHLASRGGLIYAVRSLLLAKADIHTQDDNGDTPLHFATDKNHADIVLLLIENGADINAINNQTRSALHTAASKKFLSIIEMLLQNGANVELADNKMNTALHLACEEGHLDVVGILLKLSDKLIFQKNSDNYAPLEFVCSNCNYEQLESILSKSAVPKDVTISCVSFSKIVNKGDSKILQLLFDKNVVTHTHLGCTDAGGFTPVHIAVNKENVDVLRVLLKNSANVNAVNTDSTTASHIAASKNLSSILKMLIDYKADIELVDMNGNTPLHLAYMEGHVDVIEILQTYYSSTKTPTTRNLYGYTPFEFGCIYGTKDALKGLLDHIPTTKDEKVSANCLYGIIDRALLDTLQLIFDANIIDKEDLEHTRLLGRSLLHIATENSHTDVILFMLGKGVKVNSSDVDGRTPLHLAKSADIAEILLAAYENFTDSDEACKSGRTPLHVASQNGYVDVVKSLLSANSRVVSARDRCGWTPLLLAAYMNEDACVKILLKEGADANEMNEYNETALHLSVQNCNLDLVKVLLENGANILAKDWHGNTVLHTIMNIYRWYFRFTEFSFDNFEQTASNTEDLVKTLLQYGLDPNEVNEEEEKAIDIVENLRLKKLL